MLGLQMSHHTGLALFLFLSYFRGKAPGTLMGRAEEMEKNGRETHRVVRREGKASRFQIQIQSHKGVL